MNKTENGSDTSSRKAVEPAHAQARMQRAQIPYKQLTQQTTPG
jgi:hypothetical protein